MTRFLNGQRGTAAIESLFAVSLLIPIVIGGFSVIYFGFARVWLDRSSYETLICLSSTASEQNCREALRKKVDSALPFGTLEKIHIERRHNLAQVDLRFSIARHEVIHQHSSQALPLRPGVRL